MLFKTYTGSDEREVLAAARKELGDDMLILDLRRAQGDEASNGNGRQVILRVGIHPRPARSHPLNNDSTKPREMERAQAAYRRGESPADSENDQVAELALLREQLRDLKAQLRAVRSCPFQEPFDFCFNLLTEAGVPDHVAEMLITRAEEQLVGMGGADPVGRRVALEELKHQISYLFVPPPRRQKRPKREVVAVVGPTGAGKTSLIMKLASHSSVYRDRRVGIISTDNFRAGANAGLKSIADILSIPLIEVRQLDDLPRAIVNLAKCDIILVDTPGRSPLSKGSLPDLQTQLAVLQPNETLLVLSANMALEELWLFKGLYRGVHPTSLVITKLDETSKPGKVLGLLDDPHLSLKFVTTGQAVPGSLAVNAGLAVLRRLPLATGSS